MEVAEKPAESGRPFYCSICDSTSPNQESYDHHIAGKRHKAIVVRLENAHRREEQTVFVTGKKSEFKRLSNLDLRDYFSSFGPIEKVTYVKEPGIAYVQFQDKSLVDQVIKKGPHIITIGSFSCTVVCRTCRQSTPARLQSRDMRYQKEMQEKKEKFEQLKNRSLTGKKLFDKIELLPGLSEQLSALCNRVGMSDKSKDSAVKVTERIQWIVNTVARKNICRAAFFGSKVSGLGLESSDVDMVLIFNADELIPPHLIDLYCVRSQPYSEEDESKLCSIIMPRQIRGIRMTIQNLPIEGKSQVGKWKKLADILRVCSEFSHVLPIKARIPIVRCLYVPTSIQLDISIDRNLSINNSHLLRLYSEFDPRIRPLLIAVRYWAKIQEINFLTSYALTWLLLYFLQTRSPQVCPTVAELAMISAKMGEPEVILSTWNAAYPINLEKWPRSENIESLGELFSGFFEFFAEFPFAESVIILRDASTVPLQSMIRERESQNVDEKSSQKQKKSKVSENSGKIESDTKEEEEEPEEQFRISVMNVQDPMELVRNITGLVGKKKLLILQELFHYADGCLKDADEKGKLRKLFTKMVPKPKPKAEKSPPKKLKSNSNSNKTGNEKKAFSVILSSQDNAILSKSLKWFRLIENIPDATLQWMCSAAACLGALSLISNILLIDVKLEENRIPFEFWKVICPKLGNQFEIEKNVAAPVASEETKTEVEERETIKGEVENNAAIKEEVDDRPFALLSLACSTKHNTWMNRDEAATSLRREGKCHTGPDGNGTEPIVTGYGLEFERQVSQFLSYIEPVQCNSQFVVTFTCEKESREQVTMTILKTVTAIKDNAIAGFVTKRLVDAVETLS